MSDFVGIKIDDVGINDKVLRMISENPNLTAKEIAEELKKTSRTIERAINALKEQGKIIRIGSNKTGHWQVVSG